VKQEGGQDWSMYPIRDEEEEEEEYMGYTFPTPWPWVMY
jgi:hypothetical protein